MAADNFYRGSCCPAAAVSYALIDLGAAPIVPGAVAGLVIDPFFAAIRWPDLSSVWQTTARCHFRVAARRTAFWRRSACTPSSGRSGRQPYLRVLSLAFCRLSSAACSTDGPSGMDTVSRVRRVDHQPTSLVEAWPSDFIGLKWCGSPGRTQKQALEDVCRRRVCPTCGEIFGAEAAVTAYPYYRQAEQRSTAPGQAMAL